MFMLWRGWSCLLLVVACLVPLAGNAHGDAGHRVVAAPAGLALGASAAFADDGTLWVATVDGGHVWLRRSADHGKSFDAPVRVNQKAQNIDSFGENKPEVALGTRGRIYVTWVESLPEKWASYVWFARSVDGGKTFAVPLIVHRDRARLTHSFEALRVNGEGQPVVAWIDARDHVASMKKYGMKGPHAYKGLAVYYAWSTDGGKSFEPGRKVMDHSCECCRVALAHEPSGVVAAFFRGVYGDKVRDHAFSMLPTDGGTPLPERSTFNEWQVAACPEQGPGLAISADGVRHVVWYEGKGGPHIWYGQLDPGHAPQHRLQIGGPGASHADVAVHEQTVWVAWNQVSAAGYALKVRNSTDGGRSFGEARTVAESAVAVYSPQLLVHEGRAWIAWNTLSGFRLIPVQRQ